MSADPEVALYFLRRLSLRVKSLVERVDQNAATSVQTRLARFILQRSEKSGGASRPRSGARKSAAFSLAMTQTALAEELGTVREVVVRALRGLRELGAIESAGDGKYRIADLAALKAIAGSASRE
jgi:CRP/FNR family transcriptional regulator